VSKEIIILRFELCACMCYEVSCLGTGLVKRNLHTYCKHHLHAGPDVSCILGCPTSLLLITYQHYSPKYQHSSSSYYRRPCRNRIDVGSKVYL